MNVSRKKSIFSFGPQLEESIKSRMACASKFFSLWNYKILNLERLSACVFELVDFIYHIACMQL